MKERVVFFCFLIAVLATTVNSAPSKTKVCRKALAPSTQTQGVNKAGDDTSAARFNLNFAKYEVSKGRRDSKQAFRVQVSVVSAHVAFTDATISMETTGSCGVGSVKYDSKYFFQVSQPNQTCPELYVTRVKTPMRELPSLIWTPPACGCVHIRALVIEKGSAYYSEKENIQDGALAQVVCVKKAPRQQRLDVLCSVLDRYLTSEIISGDYFLTRHNLQGKITDTYQLDLAIKLRRSDARVCCQKNFSERQQCFDDTHWQRIDRFCGNGVPDIPFTDFRTGHMLKLGRQCCFIFGEYRYSCFGNEDMSNQQLPGGTALDYSMDETDPANDVAEFTSDKDLDIVSQLSPLSFNMGEQKYLVKSKDGNSSYSITDDVDTEDKEIKEDLIAIKNDIPGGHNSVPTTSTSHPKDSKYIVIEEPKGKTGVSLKSATPEKSHTTRKQKGKYFGSRRKGHRRSSAEGRRRQGNLYDDFEDMDLVGGKQPDTQGGESWLTHYSKVPTDKFVDLPRIPLRATSRRVSSTERGHKRRSGKDDGFEDQGALSVERSLNKIEKKLQRLRIKQHCCRAGAEAGKHVYGKFDRVWKECSHSSEKLLNRLDLSYGHKICNDQFKKCCMEMSVSGPSMTSQEFRDVEHQYFDVRYVEKNDDKEPDVQTNQGLHRDTFDAYDPDAELRYGSMRDIPEDGDFFDEEYNGPLRFDDVDNKIEKEYGNLDSLHRVPKNDNQNKDILSIKEGGDNDKEVKNDDDEEDIANEDSEEDEDEQFERELGFSEEESLNGKRISKKVYIKEKRRPANNEQTEQKKVTNHKNKENNAAAKQNLVHKEKASHKETDGKNVGAKKDKELSKDNVQDFDTQALELINRPTLAKSKHTQRRKQKNGSASRRSRSRSRGSSRRRSSRRSSRRGRRNRNGQHQYRQKNARYQPFGAVAAKDSHEMAAMNARRMTGAMDSKELLEAYSQSDFPRQKKNRGIKTHRGKQRDRKRGTN